MADSATTNAPKAFISYSWDNDEHRKWTKGLAARLRGDGVDVTLDQWEVVPGDQLPKFMETAIRENSYVLIICTPNYKKKSDARSGGVGYEGDIMTAEVHTAGNHRKFIPIQRSAVREDAMPSWLKGKLSIDLSGDPYSEEAYHDLVATLHNRREQAPALGKAPARMAASARPVGGEVKTLPPTKGRPDAESEPIKIEGVLMDEVGRPRNDGTPGCALYPVPFKLNREPSHEWAALFIRAWDRPPQWTSMHRPGTARVQRDCVILTGTTIEEVRDVHRATLKLAVEVANKEVVELARKRRAADETAAHREREHHERIRKVADDLKFD